MVFTAAVKGDAPASVILYEKGSDKIIYEADMPAMPWLGDLRSIRVEGFDPAGIEYNYRINGAVVTDPAARLVAGRAQ